MTVIDLYKELDKIIPPSLSSDWDNDGLMCCACPEKEAKKVLLSLDVNRSIADYAINNNVDVIVTHHPFIFKPLTKLNNNDFRFNIAVGLIRNSISVFSFHTRLDAVRGGVNDVLSELIGIKSPESFGPSEERIGRVGVLESEESFFVFCNRVKTILKADSIQIVDCNKPVKRVALVGGSGKDFLSYVNETGADTFLTGELPYNSLVDGYNMGINIVSAGHFYTENPVLEYLKRVINQLAPEVLVEITDSNAVKIF